MRSKLHRQISEREVMSLKHLYIFRHGETEWNRIGRFQGQTGDEPLNAQGRMQAQALADQLQAKNIELIVSSPLKRTLETAEILAQKCGAPIVSDKRLIEGNLGSVEGKTADEATEDELQIFERWRHLTPQNLDIGFVGGETKKQILSRAMAALHSLAKRPETNIAVATHSTVLRLIMASLGRFQHNIMQAKPFHFTLENGVLCFAEDENILLLSCCAPCSCAVIEKLAQEKRRFSVVFYNPNIRPVAEYEKRRAENERLCALYKVPFFSLAYDNERWCVLTKGLEQEPERGKRCSICFEMRLQRVMTYALENGFDAVSSVLGVSRYKDLDQVNTAAEAAALVTRCPYQQIEGRKNGMQERRAELIDKLALYSQTYCGCRERV